jgi:hypothetical protein
MISHSSKRWHELAHAYGAADDVPALLKRARLDIGSGANAESAWFDLWSALCHQGDAYTASYAAVPELLSIAKARKHKTQYDPLTLIGLIELARLEGRAPSIPDDLAEDYKRALKEASVMIEQLLPGVHDDEWKAELSASLAALRGDAAAARALLDAG